MSRRDDLRAEWNALKQRAIARGETVAAPYEFVERVLGMLDVEMASARDDAIRTVLSTYGRPKEAELHEGTVLIPWAKYNELLKAATRGDRGVSTGESGARGAPGPAGG